ncbi:class I SAM-dependent methyltransferase [Cryptosporangium phraense]|uniref:Methyltransferase domain-containing protein n=1 Tax=Cryptosporangium phraense TaxID=2593070 RepID=A0A545AVJ0_9ACTN|nr:class I SAM-dependent methyltransferase [Cryptosporangium phraense]TQS44615.1 methyltransferase domain-containing protein [Cryptosporangium phraense]
MTYLANRQETVADRLRPVVTTIFGHEPPVRIRAWDGSSIGPSDREGGPTLVIRNRRALRRLVWSPNEVGMARAFVSGDLAVEGDFIEALDSMLHLFDATQGMHLNSQDRRTILAAAVRLGAIGTNPPPPAEEMRPVGGLLHSARRDAAAISHHYDVGNEFYRLVLGESMTYSCAYWPDLDDPSATTTLEQAQTNKVELISRKLGLKPGMRLLDVGCGWGTMAIHAAREYGVHVVGVTNSHEQAVGAAKRAAAAGVADLVEIREMDYRDIDDGPYDAISSIGMAEHVGTEQWPHYAELLYGLLKPGGRLLSHQITQPPTVTEHLESNRAGGKHERTFITAYVFPDGELQSSGWISDRLESVGFEVRDVESLREHYAKTLRAWVANLEQSWSEAVQLTSVGRARVWRLYMAGSALAFDRNRIAIHQVLAVRPDRKGRSHMPPTRRSYATVD